MIVRIRKTKWSNASELMQTKEGGGINGEDARCLLGLISINMDGVNGTLFTALASIEKSQCNKMEAAVHMKRGCFYTSFVFGSCEAGGCTLHNLVCDGKYSMIMIMLKQLKYDSFYRLVSILVARDSVTAKIHSYMGIWRRHIQDRNRPRTS